MSISWDSLPNSRDAERVMLHNVINEYKKENEKLKEEHKDFIDWDEEKYIQNLADHRFHLKKRKEEIEKLKAENEKLKKIISDSLTRKVKTKSPGDVFDNATKKLDELHEQICQTETNIFKILKEDPNWECGFK